MLSKDELIDLYWKQDLSQREIAKKIGVSQTSIYRWMKKYNIKKRRAVLPKGKYRHTEEAKRKIAQQSRTHWRNVDYKKKVSTSIKIALSKYVGNPSRSPETVFKKGHKVPEEWRKKFKKIHKNKHYSPKTEFTSERIKQLWKRKDYRQKVITNTLKALMTKPTTPERKLIEIIERHNLPFKYCGDGSVVIGRTNPDFISTDRTKKLIEIFGRVFHDPAQTFKEEIPWHQQYWGRMAYYSQLGYKCLIFWDDELTDETKVVDKINAFIN